MNPSRTATIAFRLALAVTVIAILHLATTSIEYPVAEDLNDKVSHILAFYVLAFLLDFSVPERPFNLKLAVALLGFGLLIELIQYFIPYRSCSLLDLAADAIGIALYWASLVLVQKVGLGKRSRPVVAHGRMATDSTDLPVPPRPPFDAS
jgi:VanZ family protein